MLFGRRFLFTLVSLFENDKDPFCKILYERVVHLVYARLFIFISEMASLIPVIILIDTAALLMYHFDPGVCLRNLGSFEVIFNWHTCFKLTLMGLRILLKFF